MQKSTEELKELSVSGQKIKYFLRLNPNQKNIVMRIRGEEIHLSAPSYATQESIEQLIYKNWSKIENLQNKFIANSKYELDGSNTWVKIFDQKVNLKIVDDSIYTKISSNEILMKNYYNTDEQLRKLYTFLAKNYKNWFISRTKEWATKMQLEFKNISIKNMVGKWGACYPHEQKIIYNIRLIHFKQEVIDCVIVHELAHLTNPNHSRQFWNLVEDYLPDYKELSKSLDNWGI